MENQQTENVDHRGWWAAFKRIDWWAVSERVGGWILKALIPLAFAGIAWTLYVTGQ